MPNKNNCKGRLHIKTNRCKYLYSQLLDETMCLKLNFWLKSTQSLLKVLKLSFMCVSVCPHDIHVYHMAYSAHGGQKRHQIP